MRSESPRLATHDSAGGYGSPPPFGGLIRLMSKLHRYPVLGMLVFMLAACGSKTTLDAGIQPGRYAVQWNGYVGAVEGEAIYPQFAFIDYHIRVGKQSKPQFNNLTLLTDRGPIPATVETVSPSDPALKYQLFTVATRVAELQAGTYRLNELRYADETGQERRVAVGDWIIEIRAESPNDLKELETTVGATSFTILEATMQNMLSTDVVVDGLEFELPNMEVTTTMTSKPAQGLLENPASLDSSRRTGKDATKAPPKPGSSIELEPIDQAILKPNQSQALSFNFHTKNGQQGFVALKPFLRYRISNDSSPRHYPLPHQVYARPFSGDQDIINYLRNLPPAAYHPLR